MGEVGGAAVVTGAAGAIGRACCHRLLADGYRVLAVDVDEAAGAALLEEADAADRLHVFAADVSAEEAVRRTPVRSPTRRRRRIHDDHTGRAAMRGRSVGSTVRTEEGT